MNKRYVATRAGFGGRTLRQGGVLLALVAVATTAVARDASGTLTGDWGGTRTAWQKDGVTLRGDYVSESFAITQGGLERGQRYAQQIRLGADFDMRTLAGWSAGTFHLTVNDRAGRGVSTDLVGNRLPIQEVYSSQFAKLTELSYDQDLWNHRGNVKLGFSAMGNDFGGLPLLCELVNAAFCAHPLGLSGGSGWGNYPNARWGARLSYALSPAMTVKVAAFQVNPKASRASRAFSPVTQGGTGTLFPLEVELHSPSAAHAGYPDELKIGGYYDSSSVTRQGGSGSVRGRHGFYLLGDQRVFNERRNPARGLTFAAETMWADRSTAQITRWYSLDAIYTGTFAGRDQDTVEFGYARAAINQRLVDAYRVENAGVVDSDSLDTLPSGEAVFELSYGWRALRWLTVRPDVQYVVDPGAFSYRHTPNAVAIGVQLKAVL